MAAAATTGATQRGDAAPSAGRPDGHGRVSRRLPGRHLAGAGHLGEHPLAQVGRRRRRARGAEAGGSGPQTVELVAPARVGAEGGLDPVTFVGRGGVEGVDSFDAIELVAVHLVTPRRSRRRMRPSRIRVLIVPSGVSSSSEISWWVWPP